jgi:hypothetical protein
MNTLAKGGPVEDNVRQHVRAYHLYALPLATQDSHLNIGSMFGTANYSS